MNQEKNTSFQNLSLLGKILELDKLSLQFGYSFSILLKSNLFLGRFVRFITFNTFFGAFYI